MAGRRKTPVFAANFSDNLDSIRSFLEAESSAPFESLLDRLFNDVVPMLCRFPEAGRKLFDHPLGSKQSRQLARLLERSLKKGDDLREFILDDYLVLYVVWGNQVIFLAIKHHRQLSFDLVGFWGAES